MMTGKRKWSRLHCMMQLAASPNSHLLLIWINFDWQAPNIQDFMLFLINAALCAHATGSITRPAIAELCQSASYCCTIGMHTLAWAIRASSSQANSHVLPSVDLLHLTGRWLDTNINLSTKHTPSRYLADNQLECLVIVII